MAQAGFTPISLYYTTTASAVPSAGNLVNGELAINITDGKLYYKDNGGVVRLLADRTATSPVTSISFGTTGLTPSTTTTGDVTVAGTLNVANGGTGLTSLTANRIPYGNGTSAFQSSAGLTFDGTTFTANALTVTGATALNGGTTIGDASGDSFTINSSAVSIPNGLNFDSNTLVIDATNNNIGIGTASFSYSSAGRGLLEINGSSNALCAFKVGNTAYGYLASSASVFELAAVGASQPLSFTTNGSERMRINTDGNLLIGTTSATNAYTRLQLSRAGFVQQVFSNTLQSVAGEVAAYSPSDGLWVGTTTAHPLSLTTNGSVKVSITSTGNVGIGTSSPSQKLEVAGTTSTTVAKITATTASAYTWCSNTGGSFYVGKDNSAGSAFGSAYSSVLYSDGAYPMIFWTNSTERMRLDSSGNLGIGTASPTEKLDVNGNSAVTGTGQLSLQRPTIPVAVDQGTPQIAFKYYSTGTTYTTGAQISALTAAAWSSTSAPTNLVFSTVPSGSTTLVERLRIDSSGNLGLGVTPSASWDAARKVIQVSTTGAFVSSAGNTLIGDNWYIDGTSTSRYLTTAAISLYQATSGQHRWFNAPSGTAGTAATLTQAMTLDAGGNLAVGNTSPATRLHVTSTGTTATIQSTSGEVYLRFTAPSATGGYIGYGVSSTETMTFLTNSVERMRIDSSGNLLVGTTTAFSALAVNRAQSGASTIIGVQNDGTVGLSTKAGFGFYDGNALRAALIRTRDGSSSPIALETYDTVPLVFGTNNATRLTIDSVGNATFAKAVRATITTDNDLSFDMNAASNFKSTPTAGGALTFTNITSGQTGNIILVNNSNYAITAAATTKVSSTCLATISATGTYWLSYYSDGTNVYVANTGALA